MISIRDFELEHLDGICPIESVVPHAIIKGDHLLRGFSVSLEDDGKVFACGGVMHTSPGVGTLWLHVDRCVQDKWRRVLSIFRVSFDMIAYAKSELGMHRLQATAFALNASAVVWLERLGLTQEGCLKQFGPNGEDAYMFATYGEVTNVVGRWDHSGTFAAYNGHAGRGEHLGLQE